MRDTNQISGEIVDAAIKTHKRIGPGLFESVYEVLLARELNGRGHHVRRQVVVPVRIDGIDFDQAFRVDMIVDDCIAVELKVASSCSPIDKQQILTYTKLLDFRVGLLFNFGAALLKDGIIRVVNALEEPLRLGNSSAPPRQSGPQKR